MKLYVVVFLCALVHCWASCDTALDVAIVFDNDFTVDPFWRNITREMKTVVNGILDSHKDSRIAFTTFADKPVGASRDTKGARSVAGDIVGDLNDRSTRTGYCAAMNFSLGRHSYDDFIPVLNHYADNTVGRGRDWPNAAFEAAYRVMASPQIGWSNDSENKKVVLLVTASTGHLAGDGSSSDFPSFALTSNNLADNINNKCEDMDYPSIEQVSGYAKDNDFSFLVLAVPGGNFNGGKFYPYKDIADKGYLYRKANGVALWFHNTLTNYSSVAAFSSSAMLDPAFNDLGSAFFSIFTPFKEFLQSCQPIQCNKCLNKCATWEYNNHPEYYDVQPPVFLNLTCDGKDCGSYSNLDVSVSIDMPDGLTPQQETLFDCTGGKVCVKESDISVTVNCLSGDCPEFDSIDLFN